MNQMDGDVLAALTLDSAMADLTADLRQCQSAAVGMNLDHFGSRLNEFFTMRHENAFQLMGLTEAGPIGFSGPYAFQFRSGARQREGRDEPAAAGVAVGKMQLDAAILKIDEIQSIDQMVQGDLAAGIFQSGFGAVGNGRGQLCLLLAGNLG